MKDVDINYWMSGVELGQVRGRLIRELLDLQDPEYQQKDWVRKPDYPGQQPSFQYNISFIQEMFFDELQLRKNLAKKQMPYNSIDCYLKSREEAEILYEVAEALGPMVLDCYTNEEFLNSPCLPQVHKASRKAFDIFMENEKDNKEFCQFIEELQFDMQIVKDNYYIYGVSDPHLRGKILISLMNLMDQGYQEKHWRLSYDCYILHIHNRLRQGLDWGNAIESRKVPYDHVGWYLKSRSEAGLLYKVVEVLRKMVDSCAPERMTGPGVRERMLACPELPILYEVSNYAFTEMMKQEQGNTKLMMALERKVIRGGSL